MSGKAEKAKNEAVGYGRPPKSGQFKPGRSGNPNGRPKKPDRAIVDLDALLPAEVLVGGKPMDTREAELWRQVEQLKKPKGPIKAARFLIKRFEKYGCMKAIKPKRRQLDLPPQSEVPWAVQRILLVARIPPPWTEAQYRKAKKQYLATRNEGDRIYDIEMGFEEWLQS